MDDPGGLVPPAPMRYRRKIGSVGLRENSVCRHHSEQGVIRPFPESDDATERDVPSGVDGDGRESVRPGKTMQHPGDPAASRRANHRHGVVFRVPGVDDDGDVSVKGQFQLRFKGLALQFSRGVVVMVVESTLADGDGPAGDVLPYRSYVPRLIETCRVVGMHPGGKPHKGRVTRCNIRRCASGAKGIRRTAAGTNAYNRICSRQPGAGSYLVAVAGERRVGEVRVAVDETRATLVFLGHFFSIQMRIGAATYIELNVPVKIPNAITIANGRITSPPRTSSAITDDRDRACVMTERGSVSLIDLLSVTYSDSLRRLCRFSRTRSKMITVSFIE